MNGITLALMVVVTTLGAVTWANTRCSVVGTIRTTKTELFLSYLFKGFSVTKKIKLWSKIVTA